MIPPIASTSNPATSPMCLDSCTTRSLPRNKSFENLPALERLSLKKRTFSLEDARQRRIERDQDARKVRRVNLLALNRIRIRAHQALSQAYEQLPAERKKNPPLWKCCENYIWRLTFTKMKISKIPYLSPQAELFRSEARRTIFSIPFEEKIERKFWVKFLIIKDCHIDTLNKIGRHLQNNPQKI